MIHIEQFKDTVYEKGYGNVAKLVMVDKQKEVFKIHRCERWY